MFLRILLAVLLILVLKYVRSLVRFLVHVQKQRRATQKMAGPESLPLIGCIHKMPTNHAELLQWLVAESHKALDRGDSCLKIWFGPKLVVIPLENDSAITSSAVETVKGEDYEFFKQWLGNSILLGSGERWHRMRRLITPAFHFAKIEEYVEAMDLHTRKMIDLLLKRSADCEQEVDVYPFIKFCSLDIIADCAMGVQLNAQEDSSQPYVIKERMETFSDEKRSEAEGSGKKRLNFLDLMLENQSENRITMEDLRAETDTFLFAGHDTTTHAVSWTMWCLATHPDVQERLHAEIVEHFGDSDAELHTPKIKKLKYLDQVFKEALRRFAPVPLLQRTTQNEVQMGAHTIPAGTSIGMAPFLLHHNPKVFEQPERFDPDRFAAGREYPPNQFIPFLSGPRNCIGQKFAIRAAKILIAHLTFNFRFSTPHKMEDNIPLPEVVLKPSLGVPVTLSMPSNAADILDFMVVEAQKALEKGESVMKMWVGPKLLVIPVNHEAVRAITSSSTEIDKGEDYRFFEQWLGPAILLGSGERWHRTRKMVTPAFHFAKIEEYVEAMDLHTRTMIQVLHEKPDGKELDLYPVIKNCSLDIIADTAFGVELNAQRNEDQPYVKAVERFCHLGFRRFANPLYSLFGGIGWKLMGYEAETERTLQVLHGFAKNVVQERMDAFNDLKKNQIEVVEKKRLNFLDLLLELQTESRIGEKEIEEECNTFLFAGHDTTSHAVSWTVWCLATHPAVQERLYAELIEHFGHSDAELHTPKIKELKYFDQVFKESLRRFAPVPMAQRYLQRDLEMDGHTIPARTTITISPFLLHHNQKASHPCSKTRCVSTPNALRPTGSTRRTPTFPSRPDLAIASASSFKDLSLTSFIAGQKFAIREAKIMIAHLIYNFRFSTTHKLEDNKPMSEVVLKPSIGLPVAIHPRH
ncbi:hypothetical protein M3Y99_00678700 [Aphelenchoides fujianensis]|nr:hypothetical protein M3Y99_00678700 [Aphelenchoides fujianensis]